MTKAGQRRRHPPGNFRTLRYEQRLQEQAKLRKERESEARLNAIVPSPEEMDTVLKRILKTQSMTFEVDIGGWRTVYLTAPIPMPNKIKPHLGILFFKPVLMMPTSTMPTIDGHLAVTLESLITKRATLVMAAGREVQLEYLLGHMRQGKTVGFRESNTDSYDWLRLCFARLQGQQFREHSLLDPTKVIYTLRP